MPVGDGFLGRVVNPLGQPIDGRATSEPTEARALELQAPSVVERQSVSEPLQTGIKAIDAMTPIGRGQRQLIIGDRKTGKTAVASTRSSTSARTGRPAIPSSRSLRGRHRPEGHHHRQRAAGAGGGARWSTPPSSRRPPRTRRLQTLRPYTGSAIGQHWMYDGKHVLIVFDDLSKQADGLPRDLAAAAPSAGPRGLPRRRVLPALAVAGALREAVRRARRRFDDRSADHRDQGQRHRRSSRPTSSRSPTASASWSPTCSTRRAAGHQRRCLGVARGRRAADQGDEEVAGLAASGPVAVPRAGGVRHAFASDLDAASKAQLERGPAWSSCSNSRSTARCRSRRRWSIFLGTQGHRTRFAIADVSASRRVPEHPQGPATRDPERHQGDQKLSEDDRGETQYLVADFKKGFQGTDSSSVVRRARRSMDEDGRGRRSPSGPQARPEEKDRRVWRTDGSDTARTARDASVRPGRPRRSPRPGADRDLRIAGQAPGRGGPSVPPRSPTC